MPLLYHSAVPLLYKKNNTLVRASTSTTPGHLLDARGRRPAQAVYVAEVARSAGLAVVPVLAPEP